ncbi:three component ABC system middle component [Flavobacterium sp. HSC-61S13]|uniref:three component ABC system middle component n=1 Tax=Flavobacterium sp. HSC-61S13 TaxID=2910963 RepID=UPI00209CE98D|nr:three component ABC system middle component [Flavobacterium sp. HSC-61S13]MCP1996175.1 hypothetical protein [Flavobacterium sp. HSC-61S13]
MKIDYNNIGIGIVTISSVLNLDTQLSIAKITLILPLVTHNECLNYLARSTTQVTSIEKLIAEKTNYFSNINLRYYDSLSLTFSSLQYLIEMGYIEIKDGIIYKIKTLEYNSKMGKRAKKIFQAANNIVSLLSANEDKLYLNLRIQL